MSKVLLCVIAILLLIVLLLTISILLVLLWSAIVFLQNFMRYISREEKERSRKQSSVGNMENADEEMEDLKDKNQSRAAGHGTIRSVSPARTPESRTGQRSEDWGADEAPDGNGISEEDIEYFDEFGESDERRKSGEIREAGNIRGNHEIREANNIRGNHEIREASKINVFDEQTLMGIMRGDIRRSVTQIGIIDPKAGNGFALFGIDSAGYLKIYGFIGDTYYVIPAEENFEFAEFSCGGLGNCFNTNRSIKAGEQYKIVGIKEPCKMRREASGRYYVVSKGELSVNEIMY